ncbi:Nucleoside-diphosphate-sugar epimerase [Sphingobium sp. AP50]|uniref:NAD-dependent epimerase/dehydratase family protein n=1 Tax=Sphingobium sp. AP50 TaxID=1884369 RepID=UPI0008D7925E|nr:NAD-dependent epimerase/dehydratase family protein [Sphingobium sp. AP50]SEJ95404.1 Nucleoside-diphosphate-sugar epimerase [Sphingobium sp. AP50]
MRVFIIGATGFVGSAVARVFKAAGHDVFGLARNSSNETVLQAAGVTAVRGDVADLTGLAALVKPFDVIVMAGMIPFDDEAPLMQALVAACRDGSDKHLIFTSGSGVLSIESKDGSWNQETFAEDDAFPFPARPNRAVRIQTEDLVRQSSGEGLRTYVVRPPLIYGHGGSIQIPQIFESARKTGKACYLGYGLNLYSAVHVDDLAECYRLAVERGTPGALYHTVSGEANFRSIAEAVADVVGCETQSLDYEAACELWGSFWVDIALAVNSRSIARRTVAELGWNPRHLDVIDDIRNGSYRAAYQAAQAQGGTAYSWKSHG